MKLISFDIGIKNMAYCVFNISGSLISIVDWNVINLLDSSSNPTVINTCSCMNKPKNKKSCATRCNKKAAFYKGDTFYCEKHAKSSDFILPEKRFSTPALKKLKHEELILLCKEFTIECIENMRKKELFDRLSVLFLNKALLPVIKNKVKKANEVDLIYIGKKIKEVLNVLPMLEGIDYAIIENQISPIANRMKTIQGMLAQYFIMRNDDTRIEFISSANKLKPETIEEETESETAIKEPLENVLTTVEISNIKGYKKNKMDGITKCSQILDKNPGFLEWKHMLETKKKDDLADCFLQGHWYIHKKIIQKNK